MESEISELREKSKERNEIMLIKQENSDDKSGSESSSSESESESRSKT